MMFRFAGLLLLALSLHARAQESLYGLTAAWCGPGSTHVCVEWQAVCGSGSRYFQVERSADGVAFDTAGYVAVPPSCPLEYAFTDSGAWEHQQGTALYYRIRKISDGTEEEVSSTWSLPLAPAEVPLEILMANPWQESPFRVRSSVFGAARLELIAADGRWMTSGMVLRTGITVVEWPFDPLPAGVYLLRLITGEHTVVRRVLVP